VNQAPKLGGLHQSETLHAQVAYAAIVYPALHIRSGFDSFHKFHHRLGCFLGCAEAVVNWPNTFSYFLLADEVNITLVWTSIARLAYRKGDLVDATLARTKALSACGKVKKLLKDVPAPEDESELLLAAIHGVENALDQLGTLASSTVKLGRTD
jgi:hypothetical protein